MNTEIFFSCGNKTNLILYIFDENRGNKEGRLLPITSK